MNLEIDRSGQLSYFLRDPLSDLRDLCVNLGHAREPACLPSTKRKANLTEDRKDHKDPIAGEGIRNRGIGWLRGQRRK
jgi:hypothetical protein